MTCLTGCKGNKRMQKRHGKPVVAFLSFLAGIAFCAALDRAGGWFSNDAGVVYATEPVTCACDKFLDLHVGDTANPGAIDMDSAAARIRFNGEEEHTRLNFVPFALNMYGYVTLDMFYTGSPTQSVAGMSGGGYIDPLGGTAENVNSLLTETSGLLVQSGGTGAAVLGDYQGDPNGATPYVFTGASLVALDDSHNIRAQLRLDQQPGSYDGTFSGRASIETQAGSGTKANGGAAIEIAASGDVVVKLNSSAAPNLGLEFHTRTE